MATLDRIDVKPMGLTKRSNGIWHIDKVIGGVRINRSAKTKSLAEATKLLERLSDGYKETFASQKWADYVESQFADRLSWANKTLARINKPSVVASKGRPDLNASALRALMLRCDGRCEISSIPFSLDRVGTSKTPPFGMSLDRKDSSIGYTMDNCRIVCLSVNLAMREWGESVMVKIGKAMLLRELERDIRK
ncbi:hypothetical protein [Pseudomonas azerbaijanoccidentalis]|jgi:hypothetical protein|uniref:hypothetical protein n=1 Tax=Pseudomonas azerbaijanoccidentalis TaxID=2842347 RepID=UPI00200AB748|nr:hypothetical protein [Pseudomonas azerbaijanoccidentalis]